MADSKRYREILEKIREAHQAHSRAWNSIRSKTGNNTIAYQETKKELDELYRQLTFLYSSLLDPVLKPFLAGETSAVDEVIAFLAVDVPAFRCGYQKEWFYRKLKKIALSRSQIESLHDIALKRCASTEQRREDSELRRLMIRLADAEFMQRLLALPESPNTYVQRRKTLMLEVILKGRKDLLERTAERVPIKS